MMRTRIKGGILALLGAELALGIPGAIVRDGVVVGAFMTFATLIVLLLSAYLILTGRE